MTSFVLLASAAFVLDLVLGDPHRWPHPVRIIGSALDRLEPLGQALPPFGRRVFGLGVAVGLGGAAACVAALAGAVPFVGWLASLYLAFAGLALGQLLREARAVTRLIGSGELDAARRALSMLVSRDTSGLDQAGLRRTLAETLAENFCDAFVAPMFYLLLGGPALMWFYKTISTMDSMWGYKTDRFRELGWAGARGDDLLAWLPARLSAFLMLACGFFMGLAARGALANLRKDAAKMASPNAGWPMAAAAWLCGAGMGGPAVYFGESVKKPQLGPMDASWGELQLKILLRLILVSGLGMICVPVVLLFCHVQFFS